MEWSSETIGLTNPPLQPTGALQPPSIVHGRRKDLRLPCTSPYFGNRTCDTSLVRSQPEILRRIYRVRARVFRCGGYFRLLTCSHKRACTGCWRDDHH
jgi:hypothetical protein